MIGVVSLHKVLHDGPALKEPDQLSIGESIRESRNATIRIDFEEPRFLLRVFPEGDLRGLVRKTIQVIS